MATSNTQAALTQWNRRSTVRQLLIADANDLLDSAGRPVGEIRASAKVRNRVETIYRTCPYDGVRGQSGLTMNLSALRQVGREWSSVLGLVSHVRAAYLARHGASGSRSLTVLELGHLAAVAMAAPSYAAWHDSGTRGAPARIPVFMAASHKMLAGIFGLSKNLLLVCAAQGIPYDSLTTNAEALLKFAESSAMLVGHSGREVCAGPPAMIHEALRLALTGEAAVQLKVGPTDSCLANMDGFLDYAETALSIQLWELATSLRFQALVNCYPLKHSETASFDIGSENARLQKDVQIPDPAYTETGFGRLDYPTIGELDQASLAAMFRGVGELRHRFDSGWSSSSESGHEEPLFGPDAAEWHTNCAPERNGADWYRSCIAVEQESLDYLAGKISLLERALRLSLNPLPERMVVEAFGSLPVPLGGHYQPYLAHGQEVDEHERRCNE